MLSFHNDPAIKEKYLSRIRAHRLADNIIKGIGWENGKGCAIGCILENYAHNRYPEELGLPVWLAKLQDKIFENLPEPDHVYWPESSLEIIPVGVDVEVVRHKLAIRRLDRLVKLQTDSLEKNPDLKEIISQTLSVIDQVKKCHEAEINKTYCDWSAMYSAAKSAEQAVWSVHSAALSAALSADWSVLSAAQAGHSAALSAAQAVLSAAQSAESAVWSADLGGLAAARAAHSAKRAEWQQEAKDLLELLAECK